MHCMQSAHCMRFNDAYNVQIASNVDSVRIVQIATIVSFTEQLQNKAQAPKLRQTDRLQITFRVFLVL